ncbi:MAG: polyketide synthase dehydratase domain-containing protein, partial [Chloroflexota bacterium]
VSVAAVNSPSAVTLVGNPDALEQIVQALQARKIFCRYLTVDVPYHSHYMDPLHDEILDSLQGLALAPAGLPLFSTVTGTAADGRELDAAYWWRNVREPVLFAAAVEEMINDGYEVFLEVSPHPVLSNAVRECLTLKARTGFVLHSLHRKSDEWATMLGALGALYTLGYPVKFDELHRDTGRFVRLPAYPWQRMRHWDESPESAAYRIGLPVHPLLGRRLPLAQPTWETALDCRALPFLEDHKIQGTTVYPGAAYVEMGLAAARQFLGNDSAGLELAEIEFRRALFLPEGADMTVQVILSPQESSFDIFSRPRGSQQPWTHHARGKPRPAGHGAAPSLHLDDLRVRCPHEHSAAACYGLFAELGLQYGSRFQGIDRLWKGTGEALARIRIPEAIEEDLDTYHLHPAILDACFQALIATVTDEREHTRSGALMPTGIDRVLLHGRPTGRMWAYTRLNDQSAGLLTGDVQLCDDGGAVIVEARGVRAVALDDRTRGRATKVGDLFYDVRWEPQERPQHDESAASLDARQAGSWLIFADAGGVGRSLAALLRERGETVVTAVPGRFHQGSNQGQDYQVNPSRPDDLCQLLTDVVAADCPLLRGVVHLWGLDACAAEDGGIDSVERDQELGCIAVMHTVQALIKTAGRPLPKLWLVTRGAQAVGKKTAPLAVAQAPLWGLARTIGYQEHAELWGGIIDLDPDAPAGESIQLCDELWYGQESDQLAFREGLRYIPRLRRRSDLGAPVLPPTFRADSSYLITGGLGGIGLEVARWMIERG